MRSPSLRPGRIVLVALGALLVAGVADAAGKLFKWVDGNGVTHYSDVPAEGAQAVHVNDAQSYAAPAARAASPPSGSAKGPAGPVPAYASLSISAPAEGAVLWNENATVGVAASLDPALASGHHLWFVLDGTRHEASGTSAEVPAPRGEHSLVAIVTDAAGEEVIRSAPVKFYVRQNSAIQPPQGPALPKKKPHA